jgi:protocatechuate 3,4-dioxygenase beta subunit
MDRSRRIFVTHLAKGGLFVITHTIIGSDFLYARVDPTPEQTAGPFYKKGAPIKDRLAEAGDPGTALMVAGDVVNTEEHSLPNAVIEIWHADDSGRYDLEGYRYRARIPTNDRGKYSFSTVLPGSYGGRPKHIHYKISAPGYRPLITQLYFESDPYFEGDPNRNFRKDPILQYRELIRPVSGPAQQLSVFFRICLRS